MVWFEFVVTSMTSMWTEMDKGGFATEKAAISHVVKFAKTNDLVVGRKRGAWPPYTHADQVPLNVTENGTMTIDLRTKDAAPTYGYAHITQLIHRDTLLLTHKVEK